MKKLIKQIFSATACILFLSVTTLSQPPFNRDHEPVILSGTDIENEFGSYLPTQVHAYSYTASSGWTHIPFQIDERVIADMHAPYGDSLNCGGGGGNSGFVDTFYCDPNTHIGNDTNAYIDLLDELVFMYKDAQEKVDFGITSDPQEVQDAGILKRCELELTDPVTNTKTYTYLYAVSNPDTLSLTDDYVEYQIHVQAPSDCIYLIDTSKIVTDNYKYGFLSALETVYLTIGNTWNKDLLDRRHIMIYPQDPGYCAKADSIFSARHNAYAVNKDGTVRAIRTVMGTHSGVRNTRVEWFYETKHISMNKHRVHAQVHVDTATGTTYYGGVQDVFDFSTDFPNGVSYYHGNLFDNMDGILPALNTLGPISSQRIISDSIDDIQLNFLFDIETDMTATEYQAYNSYEDLGPNTTYRCYGDIQSFGNTGVGLLFNQPTSTDPVFAHPMLRRLRLHRYNYYLTHNHDILADLETIKSTPVTWILNCNISHCDNGIQDVDEEGIDCGGADCAPCNTCNYATISYDDFDTNWGNWNNGANAIRYLAGYPSPLNYVALINGNASGSYIEYTFQNNYDQVYLTFVYQTLAYVNGLELEINQGSGWNPLQTFPASNGTITAVQSAVFSVNQNDRIRFRGTHPFPAYAALDNIEIFACNYATQQRNSLTAPSDLKITVAPNPVSDILSLNVPASDSNFGTLRIFSLKGEKVMEQIINKESTEINMSTLPAGMYILSYETVSGQMVYEKVIVE